MITKALFGTCEKGDVYAYTLSNETGLSATILTLGCIIQKLVYQDTDVTLGYETLEEYVANTGHFGAVIGRIAGRIANAELPLNGEVYPLSANRGAHQIHGGFEGFCKKLWNATVEDDKLKLTLLSHHMEEGFPGNLKVEVTYSLAGSGLCIDYKATSDMDTVVNLTNHAYFNLNGGGDVLQHTLWLNADSYTPTDALGIPSGEIAPVTGTALDFTVEKTFARDFGKTDLGCFDHNFCLNGSGLRKVAVAKGEKLTMEVETTTPGVQLYCADFKAYRPGKDGAVYHGPCFFCLETQGYPDAVHHPNFPSVLLKAGEEYRQATIYRLI